MTNGFSSSRRDLFKVGAVASLSGIMNSPAQAEKSQERRHFDIHADVIVVGAGFAGITAAKLLVEAGKKVVVLEARNRIGGRTHTEDVLPGLTLDVGGQWVGPTQLRVMRAIRDHKIPLFPTFNSGENIFENRGKLAQYTGTIPTMNPLALADLGLAMSRLDKLALTVDLQNPWSTPDARILDSQTLATWVEKNTYTDTARQTLWTALQMIFATEPSRLSLLYSLFIIKSCQGLDILFGVEGGAQQDRFTQGTHSLLSKFSKSFEKSIVLNSPVRAIEQRTQVIVARGENFSVTGKKLILAIPPTLCQKIDFSPQLDVDRQQLCQTMPMGSVIKVLCVYPSPFWRNRKLSGQAVSLYGDVFSTFDNSTPNRSEGVLVAFVVGRQAEEMRRLRPEVRQAKVLEALKVFYGEEVTKPSHYSEHTWSTEVWTQGCFFGVMPPGVMTSVGAALWRPQGHIHFAGTETAREWNGYIEGAMESGERAGNEVLQSL